MKSINLVLTFILLPILAWTQCTYLAYDGFSYVPNTSLHGASGGSGFQTPWLVQNNNTSVPGYQTNSGSLSYAALQNIGESGSGGNVYLGFGRRLNVSTTGPFQQYITDQNQGIGSQHGGTLWTSVLLNKTQNNNQSVYVDLHNNNVGWCDNCASQHIAMGYFGTASDVGGQRRWSLKINNTVYPSSVPLATNTTAFLVVSIDFIAGNTQVNFYVNPIALGTSGPPAVATMTQASGINNYIKSIAAYMGSSAGNGQIDELRFGTTYPCVAPDNTVEVNLPPTANFTMTPSTGQVSLSVALDGSSSTDPENQPLSYLWNFGDGSPTQTGVTATHVFNLIGNVTVTLTVTDNLGLQAVATRTLTVTDQNNTFPCQTSVNCMNMASCSADNGRIDVNSSNNYILRNSTNVLMPVTSSNRFENLAPDNYTLIVAGNGSVCTDTIQLYIARDSSTCNGWQSSTCAMDIGTNLTGFADWSVERPMKNLFKHIRSQILTFSTTSNCWDCGVLGELAMDVNGYPMFLPQTTSIGSTMVRYIISSDGGNLRQDTSYVLLYDGVGTITLNGGLVILSNAPGRISFRPTNNGNIWIHVTASTMGNYVRNIRLLRLHNENDDLTADPFYSVFKDKISPFKVLRFMDWGATNNNPVSQWSQRTPTSNFTYAGDAGVPYEMMIKLANELQKDPWICIPHQANNEFINNLATLFRDSLDGNLKVYLEYSNEVWNWIFGQAHYNNDNRPSNLSYGRAMAEKARNVFAIWHSVFGNDLCRVKRVLGIQGGFNSLNQEILSQLDESEWDYGSPTHYFGLNHGASGVPILTSSSTVQDIMNNAQNSWNSFKVSIKNDYNNIHVFGKEVITYEGGQHFVGNVFGTPYAYQQAMWDAQNSSQMYNFYDQMHDTIRSWGCKLATNFSLSSVQQSVYGSWGVLNDIDVQPPYSSTARKYQALLDNLPTGNCTTPNTWMGTMSALWSDKCNWSHENLPNATTDVVIPANVLHSPTVNINAETRRLTTAANAILTVLNGNVIHVH